MIFSSLNDSMNEYQLTQRMKPKIMNNFIKTSALPEVHLLCERGRPVCTFSYFVWKKSVFPNESTLDKHNDKVHHF